jgi:hypothetical protein
VSTNYHARRLPKIAKLQLTKETLLDLTNDETSQAWGGAKPDGTKKSKGPAICTVGERGCWRTGLGHSCATKCGQ